MIYFVFTIILLAINVISLVALFMQAKEVNTTNTLLLRKIITTMALLLLSSLYLLFYPPTPMIFGINVGICYNSWTLTELLKKNVVRIKDSLGL